MKKIFATILAVIYLSTSMGATVHLHYCMGKLISWGLINHDNKNCSYCGMPKNSQPDHCMTAVKGGCCKDEHKLVKVNNDQKVAQFAFKSWHFFSDIIAARPESLCNGYVASYIVSYPTANAPPDLYNIPVFLRNRNFRI